MLFTGLLTLYRLLACLLVLLPIAINILEEGELLFSLLYLPIGCLLLSTIFILLDHQLVRALRQVNARTAANTRDSVSKTWPFINKLTCH